MSKLAALNTIAANFELFTSKQLQASVQYLELSDNERTTAKAIFGCFNAVDGYCYPSYQTLTKLTGFCERTVIRHVKAIAALGVMTVRHTGYICKRTKQRRQGNNEYVPNLDRIRELIATPFKVVKRILSGSSVRGDKSQQINQKQIKNIKPVAIIPFSSIKKMFKAKKKGQYIDTDTGLMFKNMADSGDYRNCIGYVSSRLRASVIMAAISYNMEHGIDAVLDKAWLLDIEKKMKGWSV